MALKGQKRKFADAILAARPERISNREAALRIGCKDSNAAPTGSRCAKDPAVQEYIKAHWADYYHQSNDGRVVANKSSNKLYNGEPLRPILNNKKQPAIHFDAYEVKAWLQGLDPKSEAFLMVVQTCCAQMGNTGDVMQFWQSVLLDPFSEPRDKMAASENIARYTLSKPASKSKKEEEAEKARQLRQERQAAQIALFDEQPTHTAQSSLHAYKGKIPKWT